MHALSYFLGILVGFAVLLLPPLALGVAPADAPRAVGDWLATTLEEPRPEEPAETVADTRPLSGYLPGDPTPTPIPPPDLSPVRTHGAAEGDPGYYVAEVCREGKFPAFVHGFVELKRRLGPIMGEPLECEHANPENGDTLQRTSTGLAYYRKATNTPMFTDGRRHWALTPGGLVYWEGESADPPSEMAEATPSTPDARPSSAERLRVAHTDELGVVLRASPRLDDRTPRGLLEGARVTVVERAGDAWARVRADNGLEGWVPTRYLAPAE